MTKHTPTPGPWVVAHNWNGITAIQSERGTVATLTKHNVDAIADGPHGIEEANANARLIAAAPDMLAALTETVEKCQHLFDCRSLRAAIALATAGE